MPVDIRKQQILCLIGAGNNGGDGLVAARYLHERGTAVSVYLCSERPEDDENLKLVREKDITCIETVEDKNLEKFDNLLASATCIIDALLGTGKMRPLKGVYKEVLRKTNEAKQQRKTYIVAVDLPSGMDADTGNVDDACPYADMTVTLAFPKIGLFNFPGAARVGNLKIVDIGIPESISRQIPESARISEPDDFHLLFSTEGQDIHKGSRGHLLVLAGSTGKTGAAILTALGALRAGAGLVTLGVPKTLNSIVEGKLTEAMTVPLPETPEGSLSLKAKKEIDMLIKGKTALAIGPGLSTHPETAALVRISSKRVGCPWLLTPMDSMPCLKTPRS